jgi:hypothetical protein
VIKILYDVVVSVWSLDKSLGARVAETEINLIGLSASLNPLQILLTMVLCPSDKLTSSAYISR